MEPACSGQVFRIGRDATFVGELSRGWSVCVLYMDKK